MKRRSATIAERSEDVRNQQQQQQSAAMQRVRTKRSGTACCMASTIRHAAYLTFGSAMM
ncbi:hypothetical protein BZL30_5290 [Mycobacterium kansasii]|uniref:Uncharacterized protein n=1 Tax=Mycobacterium kansasii TaxID=1768 RepID=A0A1V3WZ98_MYCKA|nr:hypothetical protein BZL30_5290 [Mycobacterium kansasii]